MQLHIIAEKIAENGTVRDTLALWTDDLRKKGYSIFGINEGDKMPGTFGKRPVDIFYE